MKKLAAVMLIVAAVLSVSCAFADDGEKMTVDDVKIDKEYKVKSYAAITFKDFTFTDDVTFLFPVEVKKGGRNYIENHQGRIVGGFEAGFAYLKLDIRNLGKKP